MRDYPRWLGAMIVGCSLAGHLSAQPDTLPPPRQLAAPVAEDHRAIDLPTALRLAGVANPQIQIARQRVLEALAYRQLAAAQFLPSINAGTSTDIHTGPLQRSTGQIIEENHKAEPG